MTSANPWGHASITLSPEKIVHGTYPTPRFPSIANVPILTPRSATITLHLNLTNTTTDPESTNTVPETWALDLTFTASPTVAAPTSIQINLQHAPSPWKALLQETISHPDCLPTIRFLFTSTPGYITRSDLIPRRFECCPGITSAHSFLTPLQHVTSVSPQSLTPSNLEQTLSSSLGAVITNAYDTVGLNKETLNRLSFPFLLPTQPAPKRIAWVQGREDIDCIERALKAAQALGINLVIIDEKNHWLQDPTSPWAHLREDFIEADIAPNDGFPQRVVDAVRNYSKPIDGIVTISDVRLAGVARACEMLNLPTESPEAYEIAADKGRTRLLETVGAKESFVLQHANDLEGVLAQKGKLAFPMVVKPVIGWSSDCVTKVKNVDELRVAVKKASDRHADSPKPSTAVVVEPYVAGPEVDANIVMLNGQIIFADINDDFPSPADSANAGLKENFQETQNVLPSALPKRELDALQEQLRATLLRQKFQSGVFHCEARVRNSSVRYQDVGNGIVDLVPANNNQNSQDGTTDPEVYLHEVNARPPGYLESVAVLLAHGVDYYALRMLLALGDAEETRFRALSHPFRSGPQFHLSVMIIQQTRRGIMRSADAAKEFLEKHPDVRENVVDYYTRKKGGDILEGPDAASLWWIAFFSVVSRTSRRDLLQRVAFIEKHFDYEFDPLDE
ncbi:hypothetical protein QBC41DRAFT_280369 [Cercophora samala]|uniref:ATP-grasp domain-containing protein n=1 Tax=Cercophora samala TaxID=330535 RepID=A0AA39Z9H0_9PEZI|nr:hypothetical protein QBC41DRAFT_280369 [Cercophora samala]